MGTYQIAAPDPMNFTGQDVSNNWKIYREAYDDYVIATDLVKKSEQVQVVTLKSVMGTECKKNLKRLQLTEDELKKPEIILDKLENILFL